MLTENPTNDRLRFILKTYGKKYPQVVMDMVSIIAETVGEDRWKDAVIEAAHADVRFDHDFGVWRASGSHRMDGIVDDPVHFAETVVAMVNELPKFRTRHRADPIFPWIATQLATRRKELASLHEEGTAHRTAVEDYGRMFVKAKRGGTVLALWYERTRPNLGDWDLDNALTEAKKWSDEFGPVPQGEIVTQLKDGWTAQKLTTEAQLSREGDVMQHCVGSYSTDVAKGRTTIYSLRDKSGRPHVTIEVKNGRVQQIQGKQDTPPAKQYVPYVDEFKAWLEENDVDTEKVPAHLKEIAEAIENSGSTPDDDDDLVYYAQKWADETRNTASAVAWLGGLSYSDAELAGALESEDVTPEEFWKFPHPVYYKIQESGDVPQKLDDLVAIARMANVLAELAPQRERPPPYIEDPQVPLFDTGAPKKTRVPGHDPIGERAVKQRWSNEPKMLPPSISFETWDAGGGRHDDEEGLRWLYPAEEWLGESFKWDPDEDDYVGPWFVNRFTPDDATSWYDAGITDGNLAAELRDRRVTLDMLGEKPASIDDSLEEFENLKRKADRDWLRRPGATDDEKKASNDRKEADYARYAKVIAQQIAEQLTDAGLRRNRKRTSKRTSRRVR